MYSKSYRGKDDVAFSSILDPKVCSAKLIVPSTFALVHWIIGMFNAMYPDMQEENPLQQSKELRTKMKRNGHCFASTAAKKIHTAETTKIKDLLKL